MKVMKRWIMALAIVAALSLVGWTVYGQKTKPSRPTWEYKWVLIEKGKDPAVDTLNANGAEGWELVTTSNLSDRDSRYAVFVFKRPKQ